MNETLEALPDKGEQTLSPQTTDVQDRQMGNYPPRDLQKRRHVSMATRQRSAGLRPSPSFCKGHSGQVTRLRCVYADTILGGPFYFTADFCPFQGII